MKRDFYTSAHRADSFLAALRSQLSPERCFWIEQRGIRLPAWGGQTPVDTTPPATEPGETAVFLRQQGERFELRNAHGFVLDVRLWPLDVMSRKRVFVGSALVHLSIDVAPLSAVRMQFDEDYEVSHRPRGAERAAFEAVAEHNRQLTRVLRASGFRRQRSTYTRPRIERSADPLRPGRALEAFAWSDSSWTLEEATPEGMAEAASSLMDCRLATTLLPGK